MALCMEKSYETCPFQPDSARSSPFLISTCATISTSFMTSQSFTNTFVDDGWKSLRPEALNLKGPKSVLPKQYIHVVVLISISRGKKL
jgi:hypothetical protein